MIEFREVLLYFSILEYYFYNFMLQLVIGHYGIDGYES